MCTSLDIFKPKEEEASHTVISAFVEDLTILQRPRILKFTLNKQLNRRSELLSERRCNYNFYCELNASQREETQGKEDIHLLETRYERHQQMSRKGKEVLHECGDVTGELSRINKTMKEAETTDLASGIQDFCRFFVSSRHEDSLIHPPHSQLLPRTCILQVDEPKSEVQRVDLELS
ncbi:uncharacterized protein LOC144308047 isoform X2 [Canis aureus]